MAFDQRTRNLLQRTVTACRRVLDREFTAQLQELYGIQPEGAITPTAALDHLGDDEQEVARLLRERINHLEGGSAAEALTRTAAKPDHVARVIREQAFTVLNRLAALRLCEERGLVLECVRKGVDSEGFALFASSAGNALGETHEAYRAYLHCVFDELALDLGVLFDRFSPLALLFPRHDALVEVLKELNGSGKTAEREDLPAEQFAQIWQADETIGWIYQYYNDEAERKKMRESSAPRNSRELAVRNQFFTPRYVVEFLTDNTLGRIWFEMTRGETRLKEQCSYLVRRSNEIFLRRGEAPPEQPPQADLSQEELLKQPVHVPHRPLKDPRGILMLDPACGSMHFGLYAFDLFEVVYCEAWELEEALGADALTRPPGQKPLHDTYVGKDAFLKDVPRLIIEHNLHGIDIDPRCVQIAGLSLWLRAQRAWQQLGLKSSERPAIKRSNIVCAEPMPGEKELLREFVEREFRAEECGVFLRLLEVIFDKMQLAGEAGSLLRIEKEIHGAIDEAREGWAKLRSAPGTLFSTTELNAMSTQQELDSAVALQPLGADFWATAEGRLLAALRDYAEQAEDGCGFQRRLFAEDAARGLAFIDVCRKCYDVALMNPPFGEGSERSTDFIRATYPEGRSDVGIALVERSTSLLLHRGLVGALLPANPFFTTTMEHWRRKWIYGNAPITIGAQLGGKVLDGATIRTIAVTLSRGDSTSHHGIFFRLVHEVEREAALKGQIDEIASCVDRPKAFLKSPQSLAKSPNGSLAFWLSDSLASNVAASKSLDPQFALVRVGLQTSGDFRFLRLRWETPDSSRGTSWIAFAKGGEFSPFYADIHLFVDWEDNGARMRAHEVQRIAEGEASRGNGALRDFKLYLQPGLTYTERTNKPFAPRVLPAGCMFGTKGPGIIPTSTDMRWMLLGFLNSSFCRFLVGLAVGSSQARGGEGANDYTVGMVQRLLVPDNLNSSKVALYAREAFEDARRLFADGETDGCYCLSPLGGSGLGLRNSAKRMRQYRSESARRVQMNIERIDMEVFAALRAQSSDRDLILADVNAIEPTNEEVDDTKQASGVVSVWFGVAFGRWDIRYATGERAAPEFADPFAPLPVCPPGQLQNAQGLPARPEDVPNEYPVRVPWDGILVDDPNHPLDIERRTREVIEASWGGPSAEAIELEACEILGVKSLRDYFRKPAGFFADHLRRYSKSHRQAPIYWPLSTPSGSYTLWIYYHRLTADTLYKCLQQFVIPRLEDVEKELAHLRTVLGAGEGGAKERKRLEELEGFRRELIEFRTELELWAPKWKPNLNDGVLVTAAPLWKLFRLPKWQKDLKACWLELERGNYDWAHLAHTLWPDRVREKCSSDRSLAIAHGLEESCEVAEPVKKSKRAKKKVGLAPELEI